MANIKDVARAAGVSVSTVSNVLNGREGRASQETTAKIRETAERFGYAPSQIAKSLVSSRSNLIGVVSPLTEPENRQILANPFYADAISGIEQQLRVQGYNMLLVGIEPENTDLSMLRRWQVDGLIVLGVYQDKVYEALSALGKPTLLIDSFIENSEHVQLRIDDAAAMKSAVDHLVALGHQNIAFVGGAKQHGGVISRRAKGFMSAARDRGILITDQQLVFGNVSFEWGRKAASRILENGTETAIVCAADLLALGVLAECQRQGVNVPNSMSIVGFDNLAMSQMVYPQLTTIDQSIVARGAQAGATILELIENKDVADVMYGGTELIVRGSTAKPRASS